MRGDASRDYSKANIGVIEIEGVVTESLSVLEQIRKFKDHPQLRALVVRLETPGGAIGASQEIYLELKKLREETPVIISMGNVAASGGLYIALGGSQVVALPGSITGSMGVLMPLTNVSRLMEKIYIDPITIKSGNLKDAGNPLKPMPEEARQYLQAMVNSSFEQFRKDVVTERKLSEAVAKRLSDGRVVNGLEAKEMGIVDAIGTFEDAVNMAKEKAKIEGKVKLAFLSREPKGLIHQILRGATETVLQRVFTENAVPSYLLDWSSFVRGVQR